ncbi:hypothetical protein UVI_02029050 [Ustilaginoidea virens]|uniref:Transketolase signature 1 domain-containing protein n=1 Tax=Ustilaginoidea virens TaxID=1159556 RepID=A0A1B5KVV4_USTVR|nr:hypothetical protein UVI_02029050 [Ustilaginoidea virens]
MAHSEIDQLAINTIRLLAGLNNVQADATFNSNSGHPGAPM